MKNDNEKRSRNIFKRIFTGQFELNRISLKLYLCFGVFVCTLCMIYLMIFMGNAAHKGQPEHIYTGAIHFFLGVALVLFGLCSKGMWMAVSREWPEKRHMAMSFLLSLNLVFWAMYVAGMYIEKIWALLGRA